MLTIFSTPKPFRGHIDIIQRNAIRSWTLLGPEVEVILIGDDFGAQEVAREFGIRHEPNVRRNEQGTKYLASVFDGAQEVARHRTLCYLNCDIVLMSDFGKAVDRVTTKYERVLMVGRHRTFGLCQSGLGGTAPNTRFAEREAAPAGVD